jgi:hypothetical protein
MKTLSKSDLEKIEKFAKSYSDLVALYVFGSVATGKNRRGSDMDFAIMVRGNIAGEDRLNMETVLSNLLGQDVDLVVFGQATPLLQHQILKYGHLLYESDVSQRVMQEVAARNAYLDTEYLYKELR